MQHVHQNSQILEMLMSVCAQRASFCQFLVQIILISEKSMPAHTKELAINNDRSIKIFAKKKAREELDPGIHIHITIKFKQF